ncbi:MAG: type II toxin-antitoxin system RelE/ParE family toxin [Pseudomonadota bacterium]
MDICRRSPEGAQVITGGSAFNIKAESLRMDNFTEAETHALWLQHTGATGQIYGESLDKHWSVWGSGNWRLTFIFDGQDAVLVDYQDDH